MKNENKTKDQLIKELARIQKKNTDLEEIIIEEKRTKKELKESEKKYKDLVEETPLGIANIGVTGKIICINKRLEKISGYSREEVVGKDVFKLGFFSNEMLKLLKERLKVRFRGGSVHQRREIRFKCKDGKWIWIEITAMLIKKWGIPYNLRITVQDITERKKVEEELRDSEEHLKILFDYAPDAYYISDLKGNFIDGNKVAERLTGYKKEELIGKSFLKLKLLSLANISKAAKTLAKNIIGKPTGPDEFILNRKDNSKVTVEISTYPVKIKGRTLILGIARDITEYKEAGKALAESEERYHIVFENTGTATMIIEEDRTISMINTQGEKLSGYSKEEIENKMKWTDFVIPEDLERMKKYHIARRKAGEKAPTEYEFRLIDKKGNIRNIFLKIGMIPNTKKSIASLIDITERKQAEENVKRAKEELQIIMDSVPAIIFYKDTEGRIVRANKTLADSLKLPIKDIVGKTTEELFPKEQAENTRKDSKEVIISGKPKTNITEPYDTPDGTRWAITDKMPYKDKEGKITGIISLSKDITFQKRSEQRLQQTYQRLKKTMDAALDTMSRIIEAKDPYTSGHQHRVCQLAVPLAQELNLSKDKIEGIRIASLIHDIGKIGLPTEILSKPTKLTDIEFSLIKGHSQAGYDILKSIDFSYPVANIVLQHHENIDGSGYPNGIKDNEISIEAKILRIADTVEAMSSFRPYRPAKGIDKALEEISKNKGILYDPEVVDACLKLFKEKEFKF